MAIGTSCVYVLIIVIRVLICIYIRRTRCFIVLLCILFYLVGLAIFMSYFLAFVFMLLLSDFNV